MDMQKRVAEPVTLLNIGCDPSIKTKSNPRCQIVLCRFGLSQLKLRMQTKKEKNFRLHITHTEGRESGENRQVQIPTCSHELYFGLPKNKCTWLPKI